MSQDGLSIDARLASVDWPTLEDELGAFGAATVPGLLTREECEASAGLYEAGAGFRGQVVMARHGYGQGEYRYFAYPLPPLVQSLRTALYPRLVPIANRWHEALGLTARFPDDHAAFLHRCHAAGQARPTPLLLRYGAGDYNRLHQDLYGEHVFPLQDLDFTGGAFVLTERRARMQSRAEVVPLSQGDAVIFAVNMRPMVGPRGVSRAAMRHGVSRLHSGRRLTLGIIFHDAA